MKNFAFGLAILGVMALLAGNASAQATTKAGPKPVLVAKVEEMKTVLKLPDEMVDKMIDLIIKTDMERRSTDDILAIHLGQLVGFRFSAVDFRTAPPKATSNRLHQILTAL